MWHHFILLFLMWLSSTALMLPVSSMSFMLLSSYATSYLPISACFYDTKYISLIFPSSPYWLSVTILNSYTTSKGIKLNSTFFMLIGHWCWVVYGYLKLINYCQGCLFFNKSKNICSYNNIKFDHYMIFSD